MARFKIAINAVEYPCAAWETVERTRTLHEEWADGWTGGMGDFLLRRRDKYFMGANIDASSYPYIRLRPRYEFSISGAVHDPLEPQFAFIAKDANDESYLYWIGNGSGGNTFVSKFDLADGTRHEHRDLGSGSKGGHPAYFNSKWYVPLGGTVNAQSLDTVAIPAATDSWGDVGVTALHFVATFQTTTTGNSFPVLARAHSTNKVDYSTEGAPTDFSAADWEVGDSSEEITDMISYEGQLLVAKPSSPWRFDSQGNSFAVIEMVGRGHDTESRLVGSSLGYGAGFAYWPHKTGLWRIFGNVAKPVDPVAGNPGLASGIALDNQVPAFLGGQFTSFAASGRWAYATDLENIFHGWIREDGTIAWHGILIRIVAGTRVVIVDPYPGSTYGPQLWVIDGSTKLSRIDLDPDGGIRRSGTANADRGAASETAQIFMPYTDFGRPGVTKQGRYVWFELFKWDSNVTGSVRVLRDRSSTGEVVGSTHTTSGLKTESWTVGTNDTFRELMVSFRFAAGAGYTPGTNDPTLRAMGVEVLTPHVYRCVIPLTQDDLRGFSSDIRTGLTLLRNLKGAAPVDIREPAFNATFSGYIKEVRERTVGTEADGSLAYFLELTIERWVI